MGKGEESVYKPLTVKEYNELIIGNSMEKIFFTSNETTKEQYLKFKEFIKEPCVHSHADYVAYYIFKHRLIGDERDKYLEDEVRHRCWKMLVTGRSGYSGGYMVEYEAIPMFKNAVIKVYNKYAEEDNV